MVNYDAVERSMVNPEVQTRAGLHYCTVGADLDNATSEGLCYPQVTSVQSQGFNSSAMSIQM